MTLTLFMIQLAATLFMTGLIWIVQIVHYPLLGQVGASFPEVHAEHMRTIGFVVIPVMLAELGTAAINLVERPAFVPPVAAWAGAVLVVVIWASTFAVQVPLHDALGHGLDPEVHQRLVDTNWIRTVLWSARSALLCGLTLDALRTAELT